MGMSDCVKNMCVMGVSCVMGTFRPTHSTFFIPGVSWGRFVRHIPHSLSHVREPLVCHGDVSSDTFRILYPMSGNHLLCHGDVSSDTFRILYPMSENHLLKGYFIRRILHRSLYNTPPNSRNPT